MTKRQSTYTGKMIVRRSWLDLLWLALLLYALMPLSASAQQIVVQGPSHVSVGENFRISYTINTRDVDDFRSGLKTTDEAEVIAGPYTSTQSSYQMVNGHTSSSSSITYTYTIYAAKNGTYHIPAAQAKVGGKTIHSSTHTITISGQARSSGSTAPRMHDDDGPQMRSAGSRISGNDLFIRVSANKKRVHEQEPVLLTYKVYTLVDLTQLEGKMPDLTGFHTQEVKLPQQKSYHVENVNGRNYRCVTWSQYVMYPQMTGSLKIPSITFHGIVVQENRSVDPFEAFFNGGSGYVEVKRDIVAPSLTIQVDPLPQRPAGFSGGVGRFNISAQIDKTSVKAGEPINLRIVVGGIGNLKLIKQPVVKFPKDFDKYDPKVTDKTSLTANGVEGNMIYDILAVPRNQGKYTIPPVEFIYYDTSSNTYKTLKTQSFNIEVAPGDGSKSNVADYADQKDKDIRGIMTGTTTQHAVGTYFYGSTAYWICLLVPVLAFIILLIIFRQRAIENADIVKMRGKKANKVATRRLKKANRLMLSGKHDEFYDEVLRALWGYVSDKLNMPAEKLSRENISENLANNNVDEATIGKFLAALDECEFMRYAPGDVSGNMSKTFESAMTAIMEIENVMKKSRRVKKPAAAVMLIAAILLLPAQMSGAVTKQSADQAYSRGNYQSAIQQYEQLLKHGVSAELYYNLGNAYFRTDNITQAIIAYERAHLLSPGNDDINFNLQFARSKTIDKITPESEMFFVTWYRSIVNFTSVDNWAYAGLASIILALILILLYLFAPQLTLRKIGFYGAAALIVVFLMCNLFAYQQRRSLQNRNGAIVIAPTVNVKSTPSSGGTDAFVIHEGTRVNITDRSMKQWRAIRLADGREGWISAEKIEEI